MATNEYQLRTDEDGEVACCDCCGYPAPTAKYSSGAGSDLLHYLACEVCSSTHLSKVVPYPSTFSDPRIAMSLGWIANKILDEIRNRPTGTATGE